jgi:hypothetical protein
MFQHRMRVQTRLSLRRWRCRGEEDTDTVGVGVGEHPAEASSPVFFEFDKWAHIELFISTSVLPHVSFTLQGTVPLRGIPRPGQRRP